MKKKLPSFIALVLLLLLSACAPVDYSQEKVFPEANPDKALIYFYRSPGFIGSTYRFNVSENQQTVGAMAQDSYFYLFTNPGEHTFSVEDRNAEQGAMIKLSVQSGETYYIRVDMEYEVFGGKPVFTEVDKPEAMKLLPSRKYVVPGKINSSTFNVHADQ
ncbi:MAG: DUF2846 domain-containing protein [Gammaproteobacteria bacterium]|nr:DUF2846 domain-containing protein [Gammaproteobacteria bacterium]